MPRPICASSTRVNPPEQVAAMVLEALPSILKERASAPESPALLSNADGAITQSLN